MKERGFFLTPAWAAIYVGGVLGALARVGLVSGGSARLR